MVFQFRTVPAALTDPLGLSAEGVISERTAICVSRPGSCWFCSNCCLTWQAQLHSQSSASSLQHYPKGTGTHTAPAWTLQWYSRSWKIPQNHGKSEFPPHNLPSLYDTCLKSSLQSMGPFFCFHVVFFGNLSVSFTYCLHAYVLLNLAFCSGFLFSQMVLPVSLTTMQSPKSHPVILHSYHAGLDLDARAS